jgi:isocitrate dehydrogenase kinase/phosphatase
MNTSVAAIARHLLDGFNRHFERFQQVTLQAQALFETARWSEIHHQSLIRLDCYKKDILATVEGLEKLGVDLHSALLWPQVRHEFEQLILPRANGELAETFFNSVYCSIFDHQQINNDALFVQSSPPRLAMEKDADNTASFHDLVCTYPLTGSLETLMEAILDQPAFAIPYENKQRDIRNLVGVLAQTLLPMIVSGSPVHLEILKSLFFRNKGTYIVGRLVHGQGITPFVIPIINNEHGAIYVDALIYDPDDVSIIFSFTRSYFMVEAPVPARVIAFLRTLMPQKGLAELYNAIGLNKHGKTEFYRSFVQHLAHSDDKFILAPGIKGMVMSVFTLPSYDMVFKVIKDRFDPPKDMTREVVMEKYRLVSRHDRVGRMSDTQEYSYFRFPRQRFSEALIAELKAVAPSLLEFTADDIIIKHLYTERRMTPLNLYLATATPEQTEEVMDEYGNAIKQIASANVFPGDMLLKNFGVTRHGRVVFYDYDEICFLDECRFRVIPEPQTEEQEMSSQPWYTVETNDIFPEEFRLFFTGNPQARRMFEKHHSDLYDATFWQNLQKNIAAGKMEDLYPYRRKKRFIR